MHSVSSQPLSGVSEAGLKTTVLPATSAPPGPASARRELKGEITTHTP